MQCPSTPNTLGAGHPLPWGSSPAVQYEMSQVSLPCFLHARSHKVLLHSSYRHASDIAAHTVVTSANTKRAPFQLPKSQLPVGPCAIGRWQRSGADWSAVVCCNTNVVHTTHMPSHRRRKGSTPLNNCRRLRTRARLSHQGCVRAEHQTHIRHARPLSYATPSLWRHSSEVMHAAM